MVFTMRSLLLFICCLLSTSIALGAGVYKWTDANGNVHYGDRPAGQDSVQMRVSTKAGKSSSPVARAKAPVAAAASAEAADAEPTPAELRAMARKEAAERATRCQDAKDRLQRFVQSRRLYRLDENGEREYLSEEQTLAARDKVQKKVEKNCGPGK